MFEIEVYGPGATLPGVVGLLDAEPSREERTVAGRLLQAEAGSLAEESWLSREELIDLAVDPTSTVVITESWLGAIGTRLADEVTGCERATRRTQAQGMRALADLVTVVEDRERADTGRVDPELAIQMVAVALGISARTAADRISEAIILVRDLPRTLAAVAGGWLSMAAARALVTQTREVTDTRITEVETLVMTGLAARILPPGSIPLGHRDAVDLELLATTDPAIIAELTAAATPARIRELTRRAVKTIDAQALCTRAARAGDNRDFQIWPDREGLAWIGLLTTEANATAIYDRIDTSARTRVGAKDSWTLPQRRADLATELLLGPHPDGTPGPPINLTITISGAAPAATATPAAAAVISAADPGREIAVEHLGPVTGQAVTDLLSQAEGQLTLRTPTAAVACPGHPRGPDGRILEPGPYTPSAALALAVRTRDRTCRFPGCAVPSIDCDLDHTIPHPHGPTCICNLAALCRRHHRLKTHTPGWTVTNHGNGHLTWTTPTGQTHHTQPHQRSGPEGPDPPG